MYRGQMTDTELEAFYMQGEFKPKMKISELDPAQMLDSELDNAIAAQEHLSDLNRHQTRVQQEFNRRIDVIQSAK